MAGLRGNTTIGGFLALHLGNITKYAQNILNALKTVDGSGSGLDADVLDGMQPSSTNTANTIVQRDASNVYHAATAAVNTNTTQVATTAFVIGQAGTATPLIDGTAAVGTATRFAREDHKHPTDTSRAPTSHATNGSTYGYASATNAGHVRIGTGIGISSGTISVTYGTAASTACQGNDSRLSNARTPTAHASTATTYGVGSSTNYGHVKIGSGIAVSTGTISIASSANLPGAPTAATAAADTNTTQIATTAFVIGQAASTAPVINGTAAVGTSFRYARADHVHPVDTSRAAASHTHAGGDVTSAVANATKLATARTISLTGDVTGSASFDGSANASITAAVANDSHNHTRVYVIDDRDRKPNVAGTGRLEMVFTSLEGMTGTAGSDYQDMLVLNGYSDTSGGNANALTFDKSEMKIRHWQAAQGATSWGTAKTVAYTDSSISGNAATATKLATSRTLAVSGAVTGSASFDGSGNATIATTLASNLSLPGAPTAATAAVDTTTTQIATTAFVIGQASSSNPAMNGTVAIGTSKRYARADHVHPVDTSRAASSHTHAGGDVTSAVANATNADKLDGYHASTTANAASTIPVRDSNGYLNLGWINTTSGAASGTPTRIYCSQDAYIRYYSPAQLAPYILSQSLPTRTVVILGSSLIPVANVEIVERTINGQVIRGALFKAESTDSVAQITIPMPRNWTGLGSVVAYGFVDATGDNSSYTIGLGIYERVMTDGSLFSEPSSGSVVGNVTPIPSTPYTLFEWPSVHGVDCSEAITGTHDNFMLTLKITRPTDTGFDTLPSDLVWVAFVFRYTTSSYSDI